MSGWKESDGSHALAEGLTANNQTATSAETEALTPAEGLTTNESMATTAGAKEDEEALRGRTERPRRSAKPTTSSTDFVYY